MADLTPATPPAKRRRLLSVKPSPSRASDLLASFGARRTSSSVSKMDRTPTGHELRQKAVVSYAESAASSPSGESAASFYDAEESIQDQDAAAESSRTSVTPQEEESEDELQSSDVIHGESHKFANAKPC